jgi:hypothetical protein
MKYEDINGAEYDTAQEAVEYWATGCDCPIDDDDEDSEVCSTGNLCASCSDGYEDALRGVAKENEAEADMWHDAKMLFVTRAEALGYDDMETWDLLDTNRKHGAYMQEHGACSETILAHYDAEDKTLSLHDEEIEHLICAMGGASRRHEDTDYDDMRASGVSRDLARELAM